MHKTAKIVLAAAVTLCSATALTQERTRSGAERPDPVESFLSRKNSEHSRRSDLFSRGGQPEVIGQVRAIVASSSLRRAAPDIGASSAQLQRLNDSFHTELAQNLVRFGFGPQDLRQQPAALEAVAGLIRSTATPEQLALLADAVIVGTVATFTDEQSGDGFNSSVTFKDVRVLKGDPSAASLVLRQESGKISAQERLEVSHDVTQVGKTYLLLLSTSLYTNSIAGPKQIGRSAQRAGTRAMKFGAWYEVSADGSLRPAAPVMPPIDSIEAFAQRIR